MTKLYLANAVQVAIFECEIKGQLSDGHWENARPINHWKFWYGATAVVAEDPSLVGRDFWVKRDSYSLTSPELLDVVAGRMIAYARFTLLGYGVKQAEFLADTLFWFEDDAQEDRQNYVWRGAPTHTGNYWDEKREALKEYDLVALRERYDAVRYGRKELKADLREIQAAMRKRIV